MTVQPGSTQVGPFWDFVAGRAPAPPAAATLGMEIVSVTVDPAEFGATFQARPEFLNPAGSIQGGFLAAMLDDTMGPALAATLAPDEFAPTLELKVSFLRPAKPGTLTGRGRVVHRAGRVAFLAGELLDDTGEIVATASATARVAKQEWTANR